VTARVLILLGLFCAGVGACTGGTSDWVISEHGGAGGLGGGSEAGASGASVSHPEAGSGGDAGAPTGERCPTRFESACAPLVVLDNKDSAGSGQRFTDAIPDPATTLGCVARDVCDVLFRKTTEIRNLTQINVVIESFEGVSETYSVGSEATIHMSSRYQQQVADAQRDVRDEITSILYYQITNMYQSDDGDGITLGWLVEGVANYVRHSAGYLPDGERRKGGKYDDGNTTTGFFLVWLDEQYPDFVYELNQGMSPSDPVVWSPNAFQDITGRNVDQLWASYQASF
jgi:hypothetical protein